MTNAAPRILHIAETIIGGVATHLEEIVPLQADQLGTDNLRLIIPDDSLAHLPIAGPITVDTFPAQSSRVRSTFALRARLREVIAEWRPDIIHAHSSFAGVAARLLRGAGALPVVYCPHGWSFAQDLPEWKRRIYSVLERAQLSRTAAVINVSLHERDLALSYGLADLEKLHVVPNGIAAHAPAPDGLFRLHGVEHSHPDAINIVFIGRFARQKGVDTLAAAARLLYDQGYPILFHIVGGPIHGQPDLLTDVVPNMIRYGWLPRREVLSIVEQCDAVVMPSRWEGLPIVGLEAMRQGKPIIASRISALPEIITHGETGLLFQVDNPSSLAETIAGVTRARLATMGARAAQRFTDNYTADRQAAELVALYRVLT